MSPLRNCPKCGHVMDDLRQCPNCGYKRRGRPATPKPEKIASVGAASSESPTPQPTEPSEPEYSDIDDLHVEIQKIREILKKHVHGPDGHIALPLEEVDKHVLA